MNFKQLRAMISAGLTDEQIMSVINMTKENGPQPKEPEPKEPELEEPKQKETATDIQMQILSAINGLTETIQASNIAGAKNKEPESIDEMLENLIKED